MRLWKVIANRIRTHKAPVELYQECDLVTRTVRDVFTDDDRPHHRRQRGRRQPRADFIKIVDPRSASMVELYNGTMPLFQKFGIEREIEMMYTPPRRAAQRRLAGDRLHRGDRRHRREQRQIPRARRRRAHRLQDRHGSRSRKSCASSACATWAA